jgi:hypothetical protein
MFYKGSRKFFNSFRIPITENAPPFRRERLRQRLFIREKPKIIIIWLCLCQLMEAVGEDWVGWDVTLYAG